MDTSNQLRQLTDALNGYVRAQGRLTEQAEKERIRRWKLEQLQHAETEEYVETIVKGRKLNNEQLTQASKLREAKKKELDLLDKINRAQKELAATSKRHGASSNEAQQSQRIITNLQNQHSKAVKGTNLQAQILQNSFKGLVNGINLTSAALTFLGQSIMNTINLARDQMVANQGLVEGTNYLTGVMNQGGEAFKRGMDPVEFAKITAANRQMVNAMGGTVNTMQAMESNVLDFYTMTGSQTEAYRLLLEASTSFAQKGIKPTQKVLTDYRLDVKLLAMQTGMSAEAAASFYNEVHNDIDSITLLRAARNDEREAIIKSQRAMIQNAIAAGMSAEQAKEAAKMLNKMVAAKPLDRIKQAAKIRAMGGALGISGANEAADAVMAGKRATSQQQQALMSFNQNAANKVDQAAQNGLGAEIFANAITDKLGLESQFGPGSPFSTTLANTLAKSTTETAAMYSEASKSVVGQGLQMLDIAKEQLAQLMKGTIVWNGIFSGVMSIWNFMQGKDASNWIYDGFQRAFPSFVEGLGNYIGTKIDMLAAPINGLIGVISALVGGLAKLVGLNDIGNSILDFAKGRFASGRESISNLKNTWSSPAPMSGSSSSVVVDQKAATVDVQREKTVEKTSKASEDTAVASKSTASGIQQQLQKMDDNATMMKKLVDNSEKAVELAEKQLIALTMSEAERTDKANRGNLRRDNRFGSQYGYIS